MVIVYATLFCLFLMVGPAIIFVLWEMITDLLERLFKRLKEDE